ncbi:MarR family winged helix-turn-helix transcriptional regulator [uncultured Oscillibacter sp.]|uniref:MarR family winged helix-turn-helix transcriptional regulator n=1 Tax=uncultured Oscillibacter sp. TaxID=876091 RepID=UPI0025EB48E4|nr:MarR family transcriptional regulator [uncultured Oscillibacter sp.]
MRQINALGPTLGRAAHLAKARLEARLNQYDVTPAQTHVLLYLSRHGGQAPQCELTAFLRVKPSTANGILDRLEEKGMVERSVSGSDARRRLIVLTEKGAQQQALFQKNFQASEQMMVRGLTAKEQAQLGDLLARVIRNLEEDEST